MLPAIIYIIAGCIYRCSNGGVYRYNGVGVDCPDSCDSVCTAAACTCCGCCCTDPNRAVYGAAGYGNFTVEAGGSCPIVTTTTTTTTTTTSVEVGGD